MNLIKKIAFFLLLIIAILAIMFGLNYKFKYLKIENTLTENLNKTIKKKEFSFEQTRKESSLGDIVNINLISNKNLTSDEAKSLLGNQITFLLTRPDKSIVEINVDFPTKVDLLTPEPPSFSGISLEFKYNYESPHTIKLLEKGSVSGSEIDQVGNYKISLKSNKAEDYFFSIKDSRVKSLDSMFFDEIKNYKLIKKEKAQWYTTKNYIIPDDYKAIYKDKEYQSIIVNIADTNEYTLIPYDPTIDHYQLVKKSNHNIYYRPLNKWGNGAYTWISNNIIVKIEYFGFENGLNENENSFVYEYLEKYPSSL